MLLRGSVPSRLRPRRVRRALALVLSTVFAFDRVDAQGPTRVPIAVNISGYLQVDARWISSAAQRGDDGPLVRRARLLVETSSPHGWALRIQPDFGLGRTQIQDAYVAYRAPASGRSYEVRAGRFRPAFGVERAQPSSTLLFPERSAINSLMPSRALGAQFTIEHPRYSVALGTFHSAAGGDASIDTDGDPEAGPVEGYDIATRVVWRPRFASANGLQLHAGAMLGATDGTAEEPGLARLLTVGQQPVVNFARGALPDSVSRADGVHARFALGGLAFSRFTAAGAELALFSQRAVRSNWSGTLPAGAWSLRASRVWRGTRTSAYEVIADSSVRGGAMELGFRLGGIFIQENALRMLTEGGAAPPAVSTAGGGVALGWLPATLTRLTVSFDYTRIRRARARAQAAAHSPRAGLNSEHALIVRVQQGF